jgi:2,3-bisphosphoglycerate-dependent phosphoglycerate mutase
MKKILLSILLMAMLTPVMAQQTITTVILMRHGEKVNDGTDDPGLTPQGLERAARLAELLKNTTIDAIYSSPFQRTRNTIAPLAQAKGLTVQTYDPKKPEEIDAIVKKHAGHTVVVCGHSNTTPRMANRLLGKPHFKDFEETEFGNVLLIDVIVPGEAKVTVLNY